MADVELVIKIPEEAKRVFDCAESNEMKGSYYDHGGVIGEAIKNGVLLPKGHGRLKDIDKIDWYGCTTESDCPHKNRECKDCNKAECSKTQVDAIPTIIEADKEEHNANDS